MDSQLVGVAAAAVSATALLFTLVASLRIDHLRWNSPHGYDMNTEEVDQWMNAGAVGVAVGVVCALVAIAMLIPYAPLIHKCF